MEAFAGTYRRDRHGVWRYAWGDPVPGSGDVRLSEVLALHLATSLRHADPGALRREEVASICAPYGIARAQLVRTDGGTTDAIVGMRAPEVEAAAMMTVADVAEAASVTKATIDSYRYRGLLPEPQLVVARTPLWARPIIGRWLDERSVGPAQLTAPTRARSRTDGPSHGAEA